LRGERIIPPSPPHHSFAWQPPTKAMHKIKLPAMIDFHSDLRMSE
jgi:hypothetical protein